MNKRAGERLVINRSVSSRGFSGDEQIVIFNLSTSGCMVSRPLGRWSLGETLLISLIGRVEIAGEIVWEREPYAGVRFTSELPERIVAFLGFKNRNRQSADGASDGAGEAR